MENNFETLNKISKASQYLSKLKLLGVKYDRIFDDTIIINYNDKEKQIKHQLIHFENDKVYRSKPYNNIIKLGNFHSEHSKQWFRCSREFKKEIFDGIINIRGEEVVQPIYRAIQVLGDYETSGIEWAKENWERLIALRSEKEVAIYRRAENDKLTEIISPIYNRIYCYFRLSKDENILAMTSSDGVNYFSIRKDSVKRIYEDKLLIIDLLYKNYVGYRDDNGKTMLYDLTNKCSYEVLTIYSEYEENKKIKIVVCSMNTSTIQIRLKERSTLYDSY